MTREAQFPRLEKLLPMRRLLDDGKNGPKSMSTLLGWKCSNQCPVGEGLLFNEDATSVR